MTKRCLAVFASVLLLGAAKEPADVVKKEQERFQGAWACVAGEHEGLALTAAQKKGIKLVVRGAEFDFDGQKMVASLHPDTSPGAIDFEDKESVAKGVTPVVEAIYLLEGDTLKLCLGICQTQVSGKDGSIVGFTARRPTAFKAPAKSNDVLLVFKRQKP